MSTDSDSLSVDELKRKDAAITVVAAMQKLIEALAIDDPVYTLSVNFHGPLRRVDIARVTPDGQHIAEWLGAIAVDPTNTETLGNRLTLPLPDGAAH